MTTINQEEIQKFSKLAEEWWDVSGKFKPLHMFNPIRIEYILEKASNHFKRKDRNLPLKGLKFLDIGCGGGLIAEPMCRLGAEVTGIDASWKNIKIAESHSKKNSLKINYKIQNKPKGLPDAFNLGKSFIANDNVALILGDNFFYGQSLTKKLEKSSKHKAGATIFLKEVLRPENYGIAKIKNGIIEKIVEKPKKFVSNNAITGLYFFDNDVCKSATLDSTAAFIADASAPC